MDGELKKCEDKCPTCDKVFAKARDKCTIGLAVEGDFIESHSICGECLEALSDMNSEQRFHDFYWWLVKEIRRAKNKRDDNGR